MSTSFSTERSTGFPKTTSWFEEFMTSLSLGSSLSLGPVAKVLSATVGVVMMGWISVQALAAGALINSIILLLFLTCSGILQGAAPIMGSAVGAGRRELVVIAARHSVLIAAGLSLVSALVVSLTPLGLDLIGLDRAVVEASYLYAWALIPGLFPSLWLICARYLLAAAEEVRWLNIVMILGVVVGAYGNYVLMYGLYGLPELGLMGIGLSTSIVNWLMLGSMLALVPLSRRVSEYRGFGFPRPVNRQILTTVLRIGGPIGVVLFVEATLFTGAHIMMGYVSVEALAAHALVMQAFYLVLMIPVGFSQAATARVAAAVGRGSKHDVLQTSVVSLLLTVGFVSAVGAAMVLFADEIVEVALHTRGEQSEQTVALALEFTKIAALTQALGGIVIVLAGIVRGYRDTTFAMAWVVIGYWGVGLGGAVTLAFIWDMGGAGVWWGLAAGFAFSVVTLAGRFMTKWQHIDEIIDGARSSDLVLRRALPDVSSGPNPAERFSHQLR